MNIWWDAAVLYSTTLHVSRRVLLSSHALNSMQSSTHEKTRWVLQWLKVSDGVTLCVETLHLVNASFEGSVS